MKLLLDLGNTRLKWGLWDGAEWRADGSWMLNTSQTVRAGDIEESADWLRELPRPDGIWLASVAAEDRAARVAAACHAIFGLSPVRVRTPAAACGVRCAYAEPARLGIDRWLAIVAAFQITGGPAVAFDCGTAITMDAVTADGEHLGGLIIPGIPLMRRALHGATAAIPDASGGLGAGRGEDRGEDSPELFARDTRAAVTAGSLRAAAAFLRQTATDALGHLGPATRVLLTGGDAERLLPLLPENFEWRPRLVMEGLLAMTEEIACASS